MTRTDAGIFCLFFPACLGLLPQILTTHPLSHQSFAFGLLLLGIDQARMAALDLQQIAQVKTQTYDPRLTFFYGLTLSAIAGELLGFYLATVYLGTGIILVLGSQVWFNALAEIRLQPDQAEPISPKPFAERMGLTLGNLIALGMIGCWMHNIYPVTMVVGLWSTAIIYAVVKVGQKYLPVGQVARS
ncbi:MAG: hypothetical protein ACKOX2_12540, partial [Microcystaceae cyanobacterium]